MFAARLRQERLRRHLSQETLAEALGVSARTINRWEQGKGIPQPTLRVQLSRYFELSPEAFFEESETLSAQAGEEGVFEEPEALSAQAGEGAEGTEETLSLVAPALPGNNASNTAALVDISQKVKVSGRLTSQRFVSRRNILLSLGTLGLVVLGIFVVPLAALYAPALKGAMLQMTLVIAGAPTVTPVGLTATANNTGTTEAGTNNSGTYICWGANAHLPEQCMNLKDDTFKANQPISLWSSRSGDGLGWDISIQGTVTSTWPFTVSSLTTKYRGDIVVYFEKTTGAGHNGCIGVTLKMSLAWEPCGHADTYWVLSRDGYLVNVDHSDRAGTPLAAGVCDARNGGLISLGAENKPNRCLGHWTFI